ncbi:MAG: hypothetical protein MK165_16515 [Pirellulaceae bacterium]|nr:hypothetical protein [Pirellulaceae bacterium]
MTEVQPRAAQHYNEGEIESILEFLKRTRNELRELRKVRVWPDRVQVFDVNGEYFEIGGLGYPSEDITELLRAIGTNFKPEFIHQPINAPYKEFKTGRRHCWAEDRIL